MEEFVGIDVSKKKLDVCFNYSGKFLQVLNTPKGIGKLITELKKKNPKLVVMEATGGLEKLAFRSLHEAGFKVHVANPRVTHNFVKGTGKFSKTDKSDAKMLAFYAERMTPPPTTPYGIEDEKTRGIIIRRKQLIKMRTEEKNRLSAPNLDSEIKASMREMIKLLDTKIKALDKVLKERIKSDNKLKEKFDLLMSIKGIGEVSAFVLLAFMPELGTLSKKQIASLLGVAPMNRDSGQYSGKRRCVGGRAYPRTTLFTATISAMRHNPVIKQFAERLRLTKSSNGKMSKVMIVACMRKLITIINAMLKDLTPWDDKYLENKALLKAQKI